MEPATTPQLSERETEILRLVGTGATNQQIALELTISVNTVKTHLRNIFAKLEVESRTEATVWAIQQGLVFVEGAPAEKAPSGPDAGDVQSMAGLWSPRPAQWVALGLVCVVVVLVVLLPSLCAQPGSQGGRLVDVPREAAVSSATAAPSRWESRAQMPTPRSRFAQVSVDGLIYVIGGLGDQGWIDRVEVYDPGLDDWSRSGAMPLALANTQADVIDGTVYVVGGLDADDEVRSEVWGYDPGADAWDSAPALPEPRCACAVTACDGALYVLGGWDGQRYVDTVYRWQPGDAEWTLFERLRHPRGFLAATVWDGEIVVCGGYTGDAELALVEVLDPAASEGSRWSTRAPMNASRAGHAIAVMLDDLYVVGGGWERPLAFSERYDAGNDAWSALESPVVGEWSSLGLSLVEGEHGSVLYAVGGWNGDYMADVQAYQAVFRVFVP